MEATAIEKELSRAVLSGNLSTLMSVLARDDVKREIREKKGDYYIAAPPRDVTDSQC